MKAILGTVPVLAGILLASLPAFAQYDRGGEIYTMTNAATGNELVVYHRGEFGQLTDPQKFSTGGLGTGKALGSDNAVQISGDGKWLATVNAGSNSIALFYLGYGAPYLVDVQDSSGSTPNSVAFADDNIYVLNSGTPANVAGFHINWDGGLTQILGSKRALSTAAPVAPQIGYSNDGYVVVAEKATNLLDVFTVNFNWSLSQATQQASSGPIPFGFLFDRFGHLIVSEAGKNALSSYDFLNSGQLQPISASVLNHQLATCWLALSYGGRYVYTANTNSDDISAYRVGRDGELRLIGNGVAGTVPKGGGPGDMAFSDYGRFLYVLDGHVGTITGWRVDANGTLSPVGTFGNLPLGTTGLAGQ